MKQLQKLDMEKNMRDATVEGYREFEVYYQPIIDIQGGRDVCAGAEALIRWNSAKLGFISPAEFIPLAEYLGLINPIGNYVLTEACTRCKRWCCLYYWWCCWVFCLKSARIFYCRLLPR